MDDSAPLNVIEATLRAITFYLDVSSECSKHIKAVDGAVAAVCTRLEAAGLENQTTLDVAMQCVKARR